LRVKSPLLTLSLRIFLDKRSNERRMGCGASKEWGDAAVPGTTSLPKSLRIQDEHPSGPLGSTVPAMEEEKGDLCRPTRVIP